jgi:tetratricopeptide (TPR) repeat protein
MNNAGSKLRQNLLISSGITYGSDPTRQRPSSPLPTPVARNWTQSDTFGKATFIKPHSATAFDVERKDVIQDLAESPGDQVGMTSQQCCVYGEKLLQCGDLDGALNLAKKAVAKDEISAAAWDFLGSVLVQRSALTEACLCYATALKIEPALPSATNNIAVTLERLGRLQEAEMYYRTLLTKASASAEIKVNFAALLGKLGKYYEGLELVKEVLDVDPAMVKALGITSALLASLSRYTESLLFIDRAISLAPGQFNFLTRKADILLQLGHGEEALAACDDVLKVLPNDPAALHERALVLRLLNKPYEALEGLQLAQSVNVAPARIAADRGWLLAELGRKDEALVAFGEALALKDDLGAAWYGRSLLISHKAGDPDIRTMEKIVDGRDLANRDRIHFSFALGKSYLDLGNGEQAFKNLNLGNRLKRSTFNYHQQSNLPHFEMSPRNFSGYARSTLPRSDRCTRTPIFVFGMPRSGTTLVEQILCSHPLVGTIGESLLIAGLAKAAEIGAEAAFDSQSVRRHLDSLRHFYLEKAQIEAAEGVYFVDKMPSNFLHLGLISLILPEARMIHCRRDPLDTCLSCYATLFTHGHEYSYDLNDLGHFYILYRKQMAHWHAVLPQESILDVDYEDLVENTESQVGRILEFCGLSWDADCLRFYETKRHVKTASFNQVRLPIYKSSIRRADLFRPWLGDLENVLSANR